jgi:hypothetical protein
VQFIHDEYKEEWCKGTALFNRVVDRGFRCDMIRDIGSHCQLGAFEGLSDKGDEFGWEFEAIEAVYNAGPADRVVRLRDVVKDCIAGRFLLGSVFVACQHRVDGFVNILAGKKGKLCFVDDVVGEQGSGEAVG